MLRDDTRWDVETRLVREAWADSSFKRRLLENPRKVFSQRIAEDLADERLPETLDIRVVEEGPDDLYLVVPASCPESLREPDSLDERSTRHDLENAILWQAFQDEAFKRELLQNPKAVYSAKLGETGDGACLPDKLEVHVVEEQKAVLFVRIPLQPLQASELSDTELEKVAGGDLIPTQCASTTAAAVVVTVTAAILNDY